MSPNIKRLLLILIPALVAVILVCFFALNRPAGPKGKVSIIEVTDSTTPSVLTNLLRKKQLIRYPLILKGLFIFKKPRTGFYQISSGLSSFKIFRKLAQGKSDAFKVTFPEGFSAGQMALRLERVSHIPAEDFIKASERDEGYLFPDTYYFPLTASPEEIVKTLKTNFEAKTQNLNLKPQDVILASIVEREAKTFSERTQIASIYLNRLVVGMRLEADPTVRYGLDKIAIEQGEFKKPDFEFWRPLSRAELKVPHPYNTYLISGFPPAPIANPGISSLKAVKNPAENFPYLYFFHTKDGKIEFSKTFSEHTQKIQNSL